MFTMLCFDILEKIGDEVALIREAKAKRAKYLTSIRRSKSNDNKIRCWLEGIRNNGNRLSTDGNKLYSYNLQIGSTNDEGVKILRMYTANGIGGYYSHTTSCHCNKAFDILFLNKIPHIIDDRIDI